MKKIFFILFFISQSILAQQQFVAEASKNTIELNEKVSVEFIMNFDGDNFEEPNFEASGFKVIFGPSQSISQSWLNGRGSYKKSYGYVLVPTKKGVFTIKQASIEYNGKIYKTAPIKITVTDEPQQEPTITVNPGNAATNSLFLVSEISNPKPYVNEPVVVTYKLYFGYNVAISSEWQEVNKPKYNNFWSQNVDVKNIIPQEGSYNGQRIRYAVLRKTILYPQKSGQLEIEPLSLDIDYEVATGKIDFFGQMITKQSNKRVSSGVKTIHTQALPEAGKPEDFSGAVGSFSLQVTPSRTVVKNGEPIDLDIIVAGTGNLKLFNLPKPTVSDELEMYDPQHKENVSTTEQGMTGNVVDKYTIIPQYKGNFAIPPVSFCYFDTQTKNYKKISSPEVKINVLDGPIAGSGRNTPKNNKNEAKTAQIKDGGSFFGSTIFYTLVGLPILVLAGFLLFKRSKKTKTSQPLPKIQNDALAKKYLQEAKEQMANKELFYIAVEKSIHNFLKAKLKIETSDMSKPNIAQLLQSKNVNQSTVSRLIKTMENSDFARYTPSSATTIEQDYNETVSVLTEIEKEIE